MSLGQSGFREDFDEALATALPVDAPVFAAATLFKYLGITLGVFLPDDTALRETADAVAIAEQSGEPVTLATALLPRGSPWPTATAPNQRPDTTCLQRPAPLPQPTRPPSSGYKSSTSTPPA